MGVWRIYSNPDKSKVMTMVKILKKVKTQKQRAKVIM
jgi:hypothetical protein